MNRPEPNWCKVRVQEKHGLRTIVMSAIEDGVRLWKREVWRIPSDETKEWELLHHNGTYWTRNEHAHSPSWQAALRNHQPVAEPIAQ